jgi:hypothetical protein
LPKSNSSHLEPEHGKDFGRHPSFGVSINCRTYQDIQFPQAEQEGVVYFRDQLMIRFVIVWLKKYKFGDGSMLSKLFILSLTERPAIRFSAYAAELLTHYKERLINQCVGDLKGNFLTNMDRMNVSGLLSLNALKINVTANNNPDAYFY